MTDPLGLKRVREALFPGPPKTPTLAIRIAGPLGRNATPNTVSIHRMLRSCDPDKFRNRPVSYCEKLVLPTRSLIPCLFIDLIHNGFALGKAADVFKQRFQMPFSDSRRRGSDVRCDHDVRHLP